MAGSGEVKYRSVMLVALSSDMEDRLLMPLLSTPIYHITHVDNLRPIISTGGLLPNSQLPPAGYTNIANQGIQDRRRFFAVPNEPFGYLHDYVPFYFAPRSPMLFSIFKNNVNGYEGGQRPIVYLVSSAEAVRDSGLRFTYTDGHATMHLSNYFNALDHLGRIDWEIMGARYWSETDDERRRRMAEFLVHGRFPWHLISRICVYDQEMRYQASTLLESMRVSTQVEVNRQWYY